MNFTLQSPEGEGQKFTTRFQEPITIPPGAKVSMNFASFERISHFHYKEDQSISFFNNEFIDSAGNNLSQDGYIRTGTIFPRQSVLTMGNQGKPVNVTNSTSIPVVANSNAETIQLDSNIVIPKGSYTMRGIQRKLQEKFFSKQFFGPVNEPKFLSNFFGFDGNGEIDVPEEKPFTNCAFPYNTQYIPKSLIEDKIILGAVKKSGLGGKNQFYKDFADDDDTIDLGIVNFSSVHNKNATLVLPGGSQPSHNSYTASGANASGNFNDANASYCLARNRMIHLDSDRALQDRLLFGDNPTLGLSNQMLGNFEGYYIKDMMMGYAAQANTINERKAGVTWDGKDFMGLYSIDYAGLEDETNANAGLIPGGESGTGCSSATRTTRLGRNLNSPHASHKPPTNQVIAGSNLQTDDIGTGEHMPRCFFGVCLNANPLDASKLLIRIFMSPSAGEAWRDENSGIKPLVLIHQVNLEDVPHFNPTKIGNGKVRITLYMVEKTNYNGVPIQEYDEATGNSPLVYPVVCVGGSVGQQIVVFDGRFREFPGVIAGNPYVAGKPCAFYQKFMCEDANYAPLPSDSLAWRGSDLPFTTILSSTQQGKGFMNVRQFNFFNQVGKANDADNPLRPTFALRKMNWKASGAISEDIFNNFQKRDGIFDVDGITDYGQGIARSIYPSQKTELEILVTNNEFINDVELSGMLNFFTKIQRGYKNDRYAIYINLPVKTFINKIDVSNKGIQSSGFRKQILAICPAVFASNGDFDDDAGTLPDGRAIISGGYSPNIGITHHLDNSHLISTNNFTIEVRNLDDDSPAEQLFKTIVNFSVFQ